MPASTTRGALPYPLGTDPPDTDGDIKKLAERLAAVGALYAQGTASARPTAGTAGRLYLATDTGVVSYDTGTAWTDLLTRTDANAAYEPRHEDIFIGAAEMSATDGAPTLGTVYSYSTWLLDAAAREGVAGIFRVPSYWLTADVYLWFINPAASSGDVRFRVVGGPLALGTTPPVDSPGYVTIGVPGQNIVARALVASGVSVSIDATSGPGTRPQAILVQRNGAEATDTLPNDVALFAVQLRRAS